MPLAKSSATVGLAVARIVVRRGCLASIKLLHHRVEERRGHVISIPQLGCDFTKKHFVNLAWILKSL